MRDRIPRHLAAASGAALAVAVPLVLALATPARASVDIDCYPDQRLAHASFTRCNLMSVLEPGNDTRANLLLLLLDRDRVPPRAPPPPLPTDGVPLLFWSDFRDHFVASRTQDTPGYARGEGSRCLSNASGKTAFETAVTTAADVSADDRAALIEARKNFSPACDEPGREHVAGSPLVPATHTASPMGQAFSTYLRGVEAFYASRFEEAEAAFATLHGSSNAWLADTGDYMVARTRVNRVQIGTFDDYGERATPAKVDQAGADRATAALEAYLRDHPKGRYAASALGLERRVDWFADRNDALAASYVAFLARPYAERGIDDGALSEEVADKLLPDLDPAKVHDPVLLAAFDLAAMRKAVPNPYGEDQDAHRSVQPRPVDLETQRADFAAASAMPLYELVAATQAFYVDQDPAKVMKLLSDDTRRRDGDHLWFARQVLRGLALEARGDRNARGFWKELYAATSRPLDQLTVELGLAMHDERARTLDDVFAPGSIVASPDIRETLLENSADAGLLRRQARNADAPRHERRLALATLLWKEVTRGHYADFVADVDLIAEDAPSEKTNEESLLGMISDTDPGDIACPALATTAATLARDHGDAHARLCVAEFARLAQLAYDGVNANPPANSMAEPAKAQDLGGAPSMFPGKPYARSATYKAIIADRGAPPADRAFALYRAVMCWAPAGVNDCGGPDVPKAQREAWFKTLKREYPTSNWAKELAYWW